MMIKSGGNEANSFGFALSFTNMIHDRDQGGEVVSQFLYMQKDYLN
ncbi:hypothetical protein LL936_09905 [Levilactobacillus brevis]|nr:hypothetical protein [Levilactobacillus brevis]MCE6033922.1 hypothetical protein [Levilactobacillus brevis]MCE6039168.1 hypothetical protein [Levilactobacillus brevis]GEA98920.1 hypothetical protein LBR02_14850 [Levilactobacillus brevis]